MKDIIIQINDLEILIQTTNDEPILQSALKQGVKLIHSCLKGQCGSCRAYLINGNVDMKSNFSLFEEEVKAGQILLCQSYPITDAVVVKPIRVSKNIL